jgi:hypothetical protein
MSDMSCFLGLSFFNNVCRLLGASGDQLPLNPSLMFFRLRKHYRNLWSLQGLGSWVGPAERANSAFADPWNLIQVMLAKETERGASQLAQLIPRMWFE